MRFIRRFLAVNLARIIAFVSLVLVSNCWAALQTGQNFQKQQMPRYFEKNLGQSQKDYAFIARSSQSLIGFAGNRIDFSLIADKVQNFSLVFPGANNKVDGSSNSEKIDLGNQRSSIIGTSRSTFKVNYIRGKADEWRKNIPTFGSLLYQNVYDGIDIKFHFSEQQLEYDFVVHPHIDPSIIRLKFKNVDSVEIEHQMLTIEVDNKVIFQKPPIIYQTINNARQIVKGHYVKFANGIGFKLEEYNKNIALVIDPVITFSSYFGGEWEDQSTRIKTDSAGNLFLVGSTAARARITVHNIMTLENNALVPLQGSMPEDSFDASFGIGIDESFKIDELSNSGNKLDLNNQLKSLPSGEIEDFNYDCDYRYSGFFNQDRLVTDYDAFITKFDANFNPLFTTYYGGCGNDGIRGLAIDSNDDIYIAGFTLSQNLPVKSFSQEALAESRFADGKKQADAFYAKFSNDGELIYSSYLGGDGRDGARDIAVDAEGALYIVGYTHSISGLKTQPCPLAGASVIACDNIGGIKLIKNNLGNLETSVYSDAFVAKISPTGDAISFLTYYGGRYDDWGQSIQLYDDAVYISGNTSSPDLMAPSTGYSYQSYRNNESGCTRLDSASFFQSAPTDSHICEDVFLAKLSADGQKILFSTYLGGDKDDSVSQMKIDSLGNIYLVGSSKSTAVRLQYGIALETAASCTQEDMLGIPCDIDQKIINAELFRGRFPLYKHINRFIIDLDSVSNMMFLTVFKPDATSLLMSSFIGGSDNDAGIALALDESVTDRVKLFVGGHTVSDDIFDIPEHFRPASRNVKIEETTSSIQSINSGSDILLLSLTLDMTKKDNAYELRQPPAKGSREDLEKQFECDNLEAVDQLPIFDDLKHLRQNPVTRPNICDLCSCNLYTLDYFTLLGGEGLDALKDIEYQASQNAVLLTGTTYSRKFPIVGNAIKLEIAVINEIDFDPVTRETQFQHDYYPSDIFMTQLSDNNALTDLSISVSNVDNGNQQVGDIIDYQITVNNLSESVDAKSVRLLIKYPYISNIENIEKIIKTNLSGCVFELRQMLCDIAKSSDINKDSDIAALSSSSDISVKIKSRNIGNFLLQVVAISDTGDVNISNNDKSVFTRIHASPGLGGMGQMSLFILTIFLFLCRQSFLRGYWPISKK